MQGCFTMFVVTTSVELLNSVRVENCSKLTDNHNVSFEVEEQI
jgi:hypothetical protein